METIKMQEIKRSTMTVLEMAEYLGVSRDTIYIMCRENKLPYFKIGTRILFKRHVIDQFIESKMSEGLNYEQ